MEKKKRDRRPAGRILFFSLFTFFVSTAAQAGCEGLPLASNDTVFVSALQYATTGDQSLDENGIVLRDYKGEYNNLGKWPNPFFNALYAHALYRDWLQTGCSDDGLKDKFLRHADWFEKTHETRNGMAVWTYPFPTSYFDLGPGWYSGIGQAQVAGVLFRAYSLSKNTKYKILGQKALDVYSRLTTEGGVITMDGEDLWIQEYPNPNGESSNVLNGHMTATFALIDILGLLGKDEKLEKVIDRAIDTVRHKIPVFDAGFTSFYSQHFQDGKYVQIAERLYYNALQVTQLLRLNEIDGDPIFLDWAMRFKAYDEANDTRTAKGSTDPDGHGPGEAAGWYYARYWSDNQFPTWYEISMAKRTLLQGVYLEGQTDVSMAKDISVSTYLDGVKQHHIDISGNSNRQLYVEFNNPVLADKIKIDILSDNGNNNVAMYAIMPIRLNAERAPVADSCNHRTDSGRHLIWNAFDDDPATTFDIVCDGYIIFPKSETPGTLTIGHSEGSQPIPVKISSDLLNWRDLGTVDASLEDRRTIDIPSDVYIRIELSTKLVRIDGIKYEPIVPSLGATQKPFVPGFRTQASLR